LSLNIIGVMHGRIVSDQVQVSFDIETHYLVQIYKNKKISYH